MRHGVVLVLFLAAASCFAQTNKTGAAKTSGTCSPAVTGNNNQFKITCDGISPEQGEQLLSIMNRILSQELDPKLVMDKLDEIENEIKKGNTGVWAGYDYNGAKRSESPGRSQVIAGPETSVFQQLGRLYAAKDWNGLLSLSDNQISATPDWPTPYLFSGIANAQLNRTAEAIERLQKFVSGADDRIDYRHAVAYAKQLIAHLQGRP